MTISSNNSEKCDDLGQFKQISVPLLRRIYPQLIASELVSVQPLSGPTGLVHYLRHRYGSHHQQPVLDEGWTLKKKNKKVWRSITDPWEPSQND